MVESVLIDDIKVTDKAAKEIKRIILENSVGSEFGLRVGIKGGGCSGFSYTIGFDSSNKPGDRVLESNGVKLFVDAKSYIYLVGTELDFSDGLNGKGFTFNNPNAANTCNCGNSFCV
jgi:iron-sulfur cluster assembly protein